MRQLGGSGLLSTAVESSVVLGQSVKGEWGGRAEERGNGAEGRSRWWSTASGSSTVAWSTVAWSNTSSRRNAAVGPSTSIGWSGQRSRAVGQRWILWMSNQKWQWSGYHSGVDIGGGPSVEAYTPKEPSGATRRYATIWRDRCRGGTTRHCWSPQLRPCVPAVSLSGNITVCLHSQLK